MAHADVLRSEQHLIEVTGTLDAIEEAAAVAEEARTRDEAVDELRPADAEDAVARANATRYGLGASVWGPPGPATDAIADRLQAGMVGVNRGLSAAGGAPWVGWKMSGFGFSRGVAGLRQFMQPQSRARRASDGA